MNEDRKFGLFVIVSIILCAISIVVVLYDTNTRTNDIDSWQHSIHACPACDWTGYPGAMRIVDGGLGMDKYYCPECGYLLGEY